jgi:hypothetical protein
MQRIAAVIATLLLLSVLLTATTVVAVLYAPPSGPRQSVVTSTLTVSRVSSSNATQLSVNLKFVNQTFFDRGVLSAGPYATNGSSGEFFFPKVSPGNYTLTISSAPSIFLPATTINVLPGLNYANVTIFQREIVFLYFTNGLSINGTSPGPIIDLPNSTAATFVITNNTTLIHNFAVVESLSNQNSTNVVFNSLSITLNAGGSTNDTFILSSPGTYFYEDLIGNHARDGVWGIFIVKA